MDSNLYRRVCDHKWRPSGFWDGKTPDGKRTGGQMYKCVLCNEKVTSKQEIAEKGGNLEEGYDVYGRPIRKQKN